VGSAGLGVRRLARIGRVPVSRFKGRGRKDV